MSRLKPDRLLRPVLLYRIAIPSLPWPIAVSRAVLDAANAGLPEHLGAASFRGMQPIPFLVEKGEGGGLAIRSVRTSEVKVPVPLQMPLEIVNELSASLIGE